MKKVLDYIKTKRGGKSMNAESNVESNVANFTPTYGTLSAYASSESVVSSNDNISIYEPGSANKGWTKLHIAAWVGDVSKLKSKLKKIDIDTRDDLGRTALHLASAQGHARAVSFLLSSRADATIQDHSGKTSLHKATEFGHRECMQLLLDRTMTGLVNVPDMVGDTPLQVATALGNYDMSLLLLQMGAEVEVQNSKEQYPLHRACLSDTKDTYELVELLLRYGSLINVSDVNNVTPLMLACEHGSISIVRLFIEYGAEIKAKDINGKTAYDYAAEHNYGDIERLLKSQDDTVELNIPKIKSQESMNVITPPNEFDGTDSDWPEDDDIENSGDNLLDNFYNHPKIDVMKVESRTSCGAMLSTQIQTERENNDCDKLHAGPALDRPDFLSPLPRSRENSFNSHHNGDGEPNNCRASDFSTQETRLQENQDLKQNNDAVETSGSDWDDDFSAPIDDKPTASSKKSPFHIAKSHAQDQISEVLPFENFISDSNPDSPKKAENAAVDRIKFSMLGAKWSDGRRDYPEDETAQNKPMENTSSWSSNSSNISDKFNSKSNETKVRNQMRDDDFEVEQTSQIKECESLNKMKINGDNELLKHTKTLEKYDQHNSTKSNDTSERFAASDRVEQDTDETTNVDVVSSNSSSLTDVTNDGCVAHRKSKNDSDDPFCVEKYNESCEQVVTKFSANNSMAEQSMEIADVNCTKLKIEEQGSTSVTPIQSSNCQEVKEIRMNVDHTMLFSQESDTSDLKNVSSSRHEHVKVRDDAESLDSDSDLSINALWYEGTKELSASNVIGTVKDIGVDDTSVEVYLDREDTMLGVDEMWVSNDFILDDSNLEESNGKENRPDDANVVTSMGNGNTHNSSPICDNLDITLNENVYNMLKNRSTKKVKVADESIKDTPVKELDLPVNGISRIAKHGNIVSGSSVPVRMPDKVTSKIESLFTRISHDGNILGGNYGNEEVNIPVNSVGFELSDAIEGSDCMEVVCCLDIEEESFASSRSTKSTSNKSTGKNMIFNNEKEENDLEFDNDVDPRDLNADGGVNRFDENSKLSLSEQIFDEHSLFKDPSKNQHNYSPHGDFCHQGEPDPKFLSTTLVETNRLIGGSFRNLKKFWRAESFRKNELQTNISCEPFVYPAHCSKLNHPFIAPFYSLSKTYPFVRFIDSVLEVNVDRINRNHLDSYIDVSLAKNQFNTSDVQLRCNFSSNHGSSLRLVSDLSAPRANINDEDVNSSNRVTFHATNAPRRKSGRNSLRKYARRKAIKRKLRPRRIKYSSVESFTFSSPLQLSQNIFVEDSEKLSDILLRSSDKPYDSSNITTSGKSQMEYESIIVTRKSMDVEQIRWMEGNKNLGGIAGKGGGDVAEDRCENEFCCNSTGEQAYSFEEMILDEDSLKKNDAVTIGVDADVRGEIDIITAKVENQAPAITDITSREGNEFHLQISVIDDKFDKLKSESISKKISDVETNQSIESGIEMMQVPLTLDQNRYETTDQFRSGDELSKQSASESDKNNVTMLFGTKFEEFTNYPTLESRSRIGEHISRDNDNESAPGSSDAGEILSAKKELANGQENIIGQHLREPLHTKESISSGSSFDSLKSSQGLINLPKARWIGNEAGNESGSDTWSTKIQTSDNSVESGIKEQMKLLVDLDIQADGKCDRTPDQIIATDISREKNTEFHSCECAKTAEMDATCVVAPSNLCDSSENDKDVQNLYNASNAGILLLTTDCATSDTSISTSHSSTKLQELHSRNDREISNTVQTGPTKTVSMTTQNLEKETTRSTRSEVREAVILLRDEYNEVEATLKKHNDALDILSSRLYGELRSYPLDSNVPLKDNTSKSTVVSQEINPHFHVKALEEELETLRKRLASKWFDESSKALDMVAFLQEEKRALQATINGLNQTLVDQRIKVAELTEQNKRYKGEKQMLQNDLEAQIAEVNYLAKRGVPSDPSVVRKLTKLEEQNRELNTSYKKLLKSLQHQAIFCPNKISKISGEDRPDETVFRASPNDPDLRGASPSQRINRMVGKSDEFGVVETGVNCSNETATMARIKPTQSRPLLVTDVCGFGFGETIETRTHDENGRRCEDKRRPKLEKSGAIGAMGDDNNSKMESCDQEQGARRVVNNDSKGKDIASQKAECSKDCKRNSMHPAEEFTNIVKNTDADCQGNRGSCSQRENNICLLTKCKPSSEIEQMGSFVFTETNAATNAEFSSISRPCPNNQTVSAQRNHKESFKRKKVATKRNVASMNLQRKRLTRNKLLNAFSAPYKTLNVCRAESESAKINGASTSSDGKIKPEDSERHGKLDEKIVSSSKSSDSVTQTEISMDNYFPESKHRTSSKSSSSSVISTESSQNKSKLAQKTQVLANIRPQTTMKSENEVETSIRKSMCCKREDINNFSRNDQTLHIFCPISTFVEIDGSKEIDSVTELLARMLSQQRLSDDSASEFAKNDVCNSNLRLITEFPKDVSSQCWSRPEDGWMLSDPSSTSRIENANIGRDLTPDGGDKSSFHADNSIVIEYPSKLDAKMTKNCDDRNGMMEALPKIKTSERESVQVDGREERKPISLRQLKLEVVINVTNDLSLDRTVIKQLYDVPATNESSIRDHATAMVSQFPLIDDTPPTKQSDEGFSKILINGTSTQCDEVKRNPIASVRLSEIREEYGKQLRMNEVASELRGARSDENPELNCSRAENDLTLVREKLPTSENELTRSNAVVRKQLAKTDGQESNVNLNIEIVASRVDESSGERKITTNIRPVGSEEIDSTAKEMSVVQSSNDSGYRSFWKSVKTDEREVDADASTAFCDKQKSVAGFDGTKHNNSSSLENTVSTADRDLKLIENHPSSPVFRKRQSTEAQTVEVIETVSVGVGDSGENEISSLSHEISADRSKTSLNTASGEDASMLEPLIDLLLASLPSNTSNKRIAALSDTTTSTKLHREIKDVLTVLRMKSQLKPASSDSENTISGEDTKTRASSRHYLSGSGRRTSETLTDPPKKSNLCRGKKSRGCTPSVRFDPRIKCCSSEAVDAKTPCSQRTEFIQGVEALTRDNKIILPPERSDHGGEDSRKIDFDSPLTSAQNGSLPDMSRAHKISVKNCSIFGTQYAVTSFSGSDPSSPTILIGGNRVKPDETFSSVSCPMHPTNAQALENIENTNVNGSSGKYDHGELNIGDYAGNHWTSVDAWHNLRDELMRIKQRIFEEEDALAAEKQLLHATANNSKGNTIHSEPVGDLGSLQNEVDELLMVLGMKEVVDRSRPVPLDLLRCSVEARKVCGIIEKHVLRKRNNSGSTTKDFGVDIQNEKAMIMECINRASNMLDDIRLPSETTSSSGIGSSFATQQCEGISEATNFSHPLMDCISQRKSASAAATANQGCLPSERNTCEPRRVHREFDKSESKLRNLLNWNPIYEQLPADQDEQLKRLSAVISKASERLSSKKLPEQIDKNGKAGKLRSSSSSLASKFVPTGDKSSTFGTDTRALSTEEQMWYCQKMLRNSNRYDSTSGKGFARGKNPPARTANIDISRQLLDREKSRGAKVGKSWIGTDKRDQQQERIGGFASAVRNRDSCMGRNANRGDSSVTVNVRSTRACVTLRPRSAGASSSYNENFLGPVECVSKSRTNRGIFKRMLDEESRREGNNSFFKTCSGSSSKRKVDKFRNFLPDDTVMKEFRSTYFSS